MFPVLAVGENKRLLLVIEQFKRNPARFIDIAAANSELAIHDGRVVTDKGFLASRGAIAVDEFEWSFHQGFSQFFWFAMVAEQAMNCGFDP